MRLLTATLAMTLLTSILPITILIETDQTLTVQSQTTKPSVPEFTIKIENETIVLTIENQPFDIHNNYNNSFYYDVRIMNIDGYWSYLYAPEEMPTQSNSSQTILYYPIEESEIFPSVTTVAGVVIPAYGQVYFQVMALIGYLKETVYSDGYVSIGLVGEVSGWSYSQLVNLPTTDAQIPTVYISPEGRTGTSYKLVVFSPDDQTIYDDVLYLAFILRWMDVFPVFGEFREDYAYSIDDNPFVSIVPTKTSNDFYGGLGKIINPSFSYFLDISNLPEGYHNIVINAILYNGNAILLNASSIPFQFIVRTPKPTATPVPTLTPTHTPTSTPSPTTSPSLSPSPSPTPTPELKFPAIQVFVIIITLLAGLGILAYSMRKK